METTDTEKHFENEFIKIEFFPEKKYILESWKKFTPHHKIVEAKNKFLAICKQNKCSSYLSNLEKFSGAPSDSLKWVRDEWLQKVAEAGIKRIAIIEIKDKYAKYSLDKVLTESNLKILDVRFFNTQQEAENWIIENDKKQ